MHPMLAVFALNARGASGASVLLTAHCDNSVRVRISAPGTSVQANAVGALAETCSTSAAAVSSTINGNGSLTNGNVTACCKSQITACWYRESRTELCSSKALSQRLKVAQRVEQIILELQLTSQQPIRRSGTALIKWNLKPRHIAPIRATNQSSAVRHCCVTACRMSTSRL